MPKTTNTIRCRNEAKVKKTVGVPVRFQLQCDQICVMNFFEYMALIEVGFDILNSCNANKTNFTTSTSSLGEATVHFTLKRFFTAIICSSQKNPFPSHRLGFNYLGR